MSAAGNVIKQLPNKLCRRASLCVERYRAIIDDAPINKMHVTRLCSVDVTAANNKMVSPAYIHRATMLLLVYFVVYAAAAFFSPLIQ